MDQTDYKIVRILCKDARTPFQRIAKTLGIGTDTVIRRYNKLKEDGVILGSTVVLNSK
ncbi:MAG: transcriptional regulator, partial [Candidatus Bathyarchaeum sp.]